MTPAQTPLDRAILAYRANPTPQNHARLMAAQAAHATIFYRAQADEYVTRTKRES